MARLSGPLTFLCPILVGGGRDWIPGSGKSAHEGKGPWPVIPGPRRRSDTELMVQQNEHLEHCCCELQLANGARPNVPQTPRKPRANVS